MTTANISRNLDIDFSLPQIKENIEKVVDLGAYTINNKNEIFNTYRIGKMDGLELVFMNITLKKNEENQTNISIEVIEILRNTGHEIIINRVIDNFLDRLSKSLIGLDDEEIKKPAQKGCFMTILFIAGLIIIAFS